METNSVKKIAVVVSLLLISSCSTLTTKNEPNNVAETLIAQDFVNTMVQIDGLSPFSTVLQFDVSELAQSRSEASSVFGKALREAASQSGYSIQTIRGGNGQHRVRFSVTQAANSQIGAPATYDVSVGSIDFRRVYRPLTNGGVEPYRAMLVRGADVSNIQSDDSIFADPEQLPPANDLIAREQPGNQLAPQSGFDSPVARNDARRRLQANTEIEQASLSQTFESNTTLTPEPSVLMSAQRTPEINPLDGIGKQNIADLGASNYDSLLATKQNVAEQVLIFGDDSYVLGARNKQILGQVMDSFNPATDVVSIVGCSTGATKIDNGNAALAIGRANRVKEALLYSGVPHDKIYDEGCWSPEANSTPFPNRGVVITVKRDVKKG